MKYKAIILNDYIGLNYATWVNEKKKTIETRMKLFNYSGDIVICCGNKSTTRDKGKALCLIHFGKGRVMKKEDEANACIECVPGRIAYDLTNRRDFNRRFTFSKQKVAGSFQGIFEIELPADVRVIEPLPILNLERV